MSDLIKVCEEVKPANGTAEFRRIITGHDRNGKAIFIEDEICPNRFVMGNNPFFVDNEIWVTQTTPSENSGDGQDPATNFTLNPPTTGNVFRILEISPDRDNGVDDQGVPVKPPMHRTASLDYAYIIQGEAYAVLDEDEKLMRKGDILIQRGTRHAWSNRSEEPCIILFVLCGAEKLKELPVD